MKRFCEDWGCPAAPTCARHYGRSREYHSGIISEDFDHNGRKSVRFEFFKGDRTDPFEELRPGEEFDSCDEFNYDAPRAWLQPLNGQFALAHFITGNVDRLMNCAGRA